MRVFIIKTALGTGPRKSTQRRTRQEQDTGRETTAAQARSQDDDGFLPCSAHTACWTHSLGLTLWLSAN